MVAQVLLILLHQTLAEGAVVVVLAHQEIMVQALQMG
jgi:hypothetical protein